MGAYPLAQAQEQLARLVDEALTGEVVTITRDGKPVVTLAPTGPERRPEPEPLTDEYLEGMRKRRALRHPRSLCSRIRPLGAPSSPT